MIYVFEGARNSGKTYLSTEVSHIMGLPRFQFDFGKYFNLLGLESKDNREAHSFSMGKEMMLMQIARDINKDLPNFIHDRGIMTVLAWGLSEGRIFKHDVIEQANFIKNNGLLDGVFIILIEGKNPDASARNKDQWDYADGSDLEREAFQFVYDVFVQLSFPMVMIKNGFNSDSLKELTKLMTTLIDQ
jgi:hypothetical protein